MATTWFLAKSVRVLFSGWLVCRLFESTSGCIRYLFICSGSISGCIRRDAFELRNMPSKIKDVLTMRLPSVATMLRQVAL